MKSYDTFRPLYLENWCITQWPWSQIITDKGWYELWVWWSARQCNTMPNCFHQQRPFKYWVALQQHRIQGSMDTTWTREVPSLLFSWEVCDITDHDPWLEILSKDVATLSQQLQHFLLRIHQYRVCIIKNMAWFIHCKTGCLKKTNRK